MPDSTAKLRIFVDLDLSATARQLLLRATGGHQILLPADRGGCVLTQGPAKSQLASAEVVFGQPDPAALAVAPHLQWVHISSSGITRYDNRDFREQMSRRKIPVTNSAHVFNEFCATHVLAFILANARRLPNSLNSNIPYSTGPWHILRNSCIPLNGQSLLIVGYGAIGQRLVELLAPFHMNISAYRRQPRGDEKIPILSLDQLASGLLAADHVVNLLPESSSTRHFFDAPRLAQLKPGAVFYNIGRGSTVDQSALLAALGNTLSAAWLDVTDPEPLPPDHPLLAQPNCFITPHIAGGHAEEVKSLVQHFLQNLQRFQQGQPLHDRVM